MQIRFTLSALLITSAIAGAQAPTMMPIDLENSAEAGWLKKPVLASRMLDDMTKPGNWAFQGTGKLSFPSNDASQTYRFRKLACGEKAPERTFGNAKQLRDSLGGNQERFIAHAAPPAVCRSAGIVQRLRP